MIQVAQANGLVQANKSLKRMTRDIERQRYEIRNPGSYERIKRAELEHENVDVSYSNQVLNVG